MDVQAWLSERLPPLERALDERLPPAAAPPSELHRAMRHLVFPGGKRLRPAYAMASAEALSHPAESALPAATAVELIHIYSLIHDDLPCMDDDDERRGRPTVHVLHGEATAVLAGDALQALAFEALAHASDPARAGLAARDLAAAAGAAGIVGGQVDDLACVGESPDEATVLGVHARKSAALFAAAAACGARLAGGSEEQIDTLRDFGRETGIAFQIADDRLDEDEDDACSLVRLLGRDAAMERAEALLEGALARLEGWGEPAEPLRELARFAVRRDR